MVWNRQNYGFTVLACSLFFVILLSATCAGESKKKGVNPDGLIGSFGVFLCGQYLSVTSNNSVPTRDHQQLGLGFSLPINPRFTLTGSYRAEPNDTLFHNAGLGFTIYSKASSPEISSVNPDGPTGNPVISVEASIRIRDNRSENNRLRISGLLLLPTTPHLTFGAGTNYNDTDDFFIIDEYFGVLAWYMKSYALDRPYLNPDGPPGYPVFRLTGGGNSDGLFGQLDMVVPMSPRYSLIVWARGEKINDYEIKKIGLGVGVSLYPGNH